MSGPEKLKLVWSPAARRDLVRLRSFIEPHNPQAAARAAEKIRQAAHMILENPAIETRLEGRQDREFFTPFGQGGYIVGYQIIGTTMVILKIWHGREDRIS